MKIQRAPATLYIQSLSLSLVQRGLYFDHTLIGLRNRLFHGQSCYLRIRRLKVVLRLRSCVWHRGHPWSNPNSICVVIFPMDLSALLLRMCVCYGTCGTNLFSLVWNHFVFTNVKNLCNLLICNERTLFPSLWRRKLFYRNRVYLNNE